MMLHEQRSNLHKEDMAVGVFQDISHNGSNITSTATAFSSLPSATESNLKGNRLPLEGMHDYAGHPVVLFIVTLTASGSFCDCSTHTFTSHGRGKPGAGISLLLQKIPDTRIKKPYVVLEFFLPIIRFPSDDSSFSPQPGKEGDRELQEFLLIEKQKAQFNAQIHEFNDFCWEKCVDKPGSKLDNKTETCISNCVERFIDVSVLVTNRFAQLLQKGSM